MSRALMVAGCAALLSVACASRGPIEDPVVDELAIGSCGGATAPLGVDEGMGFAPTRLPRCDGRMFAFYGDDEGFCDASFTVVSVAAGWCAPCIRETAQLESEIVAEFGDRGVRVMQVLVQDGDYREPTPEYCASWERRFDLERVSVVIDPGGDLGGYYPGGALPATFIIDGAGVIVHRELGASDGLDTLRGALEELL